MAGWVAGVDTHQRSHYAAVLDATGRLLGSAEFAATAAGYAEMVDWLTAQSPAGQLVDRVGVESSGGYGAGLTRHLLVAGFDVVEVNRPERVSLARRGKSDPLDAESAARQVLSGQATARPKITTGVVEALRMVKIPRDSAVKDRTRAYCQLRDLVTTAPEVIHDELIAMTGRQRVAVALRWRPDRTRLTDPVQAAKHALQTLARRIQSLDTEIAAADQVIDQITADLVPTLRAEPHVGPQTAAVLAISAGQNIDRMGSEASFAKLTGTAPLPASSGKRQHRHRLNPGGDRHANSALHLIVIGRLGRHPETRAYAARRAQENLTTNETIRCLKRNLVRRVYRALRSDLMTT